MASGSTGPPRLSSACRSPWRSPATSSVFSIVSALLLRPFPYPEAERLLFVWDAPKERPDDTSALSPANFVDLKNGARTLSALEAFSFRSFNLTGGDQPEEVRAVAATPGAFGMLGFRAIHGRGFRLEEGLPGNDRVALLAQPLWQRRFGGDPRIVGTAIQLDDESYTVIGILSGEVEFLTTDTGVWVPLALDPARLPRDERSLIAMGRAAPGVGIEAAKQELARLGQELAVAHPETNRGFETRAVTLREQIPGPTDRQLFALMQAVMVLVLLIACANVANLLLARGQERQREIALRTTLGAGRGRVVRLLLTESILLAGLGGALGLALSAWTIDFMGKMLAGQLPQAFTPQLDGTVALFTAGVALVAGILFGLFPALEVSSPNLAITLREGGKGASGSRRRRRVIRGLVVAEIAFALGALSATGLLVRSMVYIQTLDPGFDATNLVTLRVALPERRYPEKEPATRFYPQLAERLAAVPGVEGVTAATALPRTNNQPVSSFSIDGRAATDAQPPEEVALSVLPSYFEVMRIPLVNGRGFGPADRLDGAPVAVVSRVFAKRYFPEGEAIGRRLTIGGESREIVGVTADVVQGRLLDRDGPRPVIFLPQAQTGARELFLFVRTPGRPAALADSIRATVWRLDRALPVADLATLEERIAREFVGARLLSGILASFGLVALLLAALGIYGVIAYSVAQQTREIGVRMAIGAQRGTVLRQVAGQGLAMTAIGLVLGAPLVYLGVKGISAALSGLVPQAAITVPAIALALALVAALASFLPAQKAAAMDPAIALRAD